MCTSVRSPTRSRSIGGGVAREARAPLEHHEVERLLRAEVLPDRAPRRRRVSSRRRGWRAARRRSPPPPDRRVASTRARTWRSRSLRARRARRGSASISAGMPLVGDDAVPDVRHLPAQEVHVADDDAGRGGDARGSVAPLPLPELVGDERGERVDAPAPRRRRRRAATIVEPHSAASIITPMMLLPFTSARPARW